MEETKAIVQRHAVNPGIGGNETQHVPWRLDRGDIDGIAPKLSSRQTIHSSGDYHPQGVYP